MSAILWRIIIAVICVALALALVPLLVGLLGVGDAGTIVQILRICIVGIAVLWVLTGSRWSAPPAP